MILRSGFYLEVVGEAHGESTDNEAGVVEEQSEQSIIIDFYILCNINYSSQKKLIVKKEEPVHLERDDTKYESCSGICDTLTLPWLTVW